MKYMTEMQKTAITTLKIGESGKVTEIQHPLKKGEKIILEHENNRAELESLADTETGGTAHLKMLNHWKK